MKNYDSISIEDAMALFTDGKVQYTGKDEHRGEAGGRYVDTLWHYGWDGEWLLCVKTSGYSHNNETSTSYLLNKGK